MSKSTKQTSTQQLDPQMQNFRNQVIGAAQGAAKDYTTLDPNALTTGAASNFGNYANAGNAGLAALTGDPSAVSQFMNPYISDVVDAMNSQFGRQAQGTMSAVNSDATARGAFGGSRAAIAQGAALSNMNANQAQQIAQLYSSGYGSAMQQALQAANLGMGANSQLAGLGDYIRNIQMQQANPGVQKLGILKGTISGLPYGTNTTNTQQGSWLNTLGGIAGLASSFFMPGAGGGLTPSLAGPAMSGEGFDPGNLGAVGAPPQVNLGMGGY